MNENLKMMCEKRAAKEAESYPPDNHPAERGITELLLQAVHDGEVGAARVYRELTQDAFTYDHAAARWYQWAGHYWAEDIRAESLAAVDLVVDAFTVEAKRQAWNAIKAAKAGDVAAQKKHEKAVSEINRVISALQNLQKRKNVLELSAVGNGLTGQEWDRLPYSLACTNGVVDLRTGQHRPGKPDDYLKTHCPTEWRGLEEACPTWERFLLEVFAADQKLIDFVQRLFGYGISGTAELHILPILWGGGRNGKGTLLEALKHALGDYAFKAESELLLEQKFAKASGAPNSGVLSLRGKRLVWVSETDEGKRLNTSRVKELVGGDTLNARGLYSRHHVEFRPSHLLIMMTNNKPQAPANDYALWQRIHLIPFTQAFVANPTGQNEHKADPQLPEKLKAEASGILAWLVRGCLEYQRQGLNPPSVVRDSTEAYRQDEDLIGHFLKDRCIIGQGYEVQAGHLYSEYQSWCLENGHRPMGGTKFGREISRRYDSYQRRHTFYVGVGLVTNE